ncbi:MAG: hypothetical protein CFE26_00060 [Verrucomicrobiales bacterium VVV1]|nr:MAG: hypothetical protein CFE26_00060 [Verrucomicrobiales bacterium VVV1]
MPDAGHEEIARSVSAVLAAARAMPVAEDLGPELQQIEMAEARGYFLPDEDESVRLRYLQYLGVRTALLEIPISLAPGSGEKDWISRLPSFVTAFAAACVLVRATRFLTELAVAHPVLWKKLDEEDLRIGLPRKTFTRLYRASASPESLARFRAAAEFYHEHRKQISGLSEDSVVGPVVALLGEEEALIDRRKRGAVWRHLVYRWFSFRRRHRSAWRQVMFGLFEAGGSAIADLRQPGIKPSGAPKRLSPSVRDELLATLRPGDVCVTRHDDALSNLFLPGFWPHATLYLGSAEERRAIGVVLPSEIETRATGPIRFLESKKDGVRFRPAEETLAVDACVVLRPSLQSAELARAIGRAMEHEGKLYDFLFDFRTSDRLACTEVIYRGFHGIGPVSFQLKEVSGRKCLPAEDLLDQALACGFTIHATTGLEGDSVLFGDAAERAFRATR